jgi:hypothetical protein
MAANDNADGCPSCFINHILVAKKIQEQFTLSLEPAYDCSICYIADDQEINYFSSFFYPCKKASFIPFAKYQA